jgi:hypothetical protein
MGYPLTYTKPDHDALKAHCIPARAAGLGINHSDDNGEQAFHEHSSGNDINGFNRNVIM